MEKHTYFSKYLPQIQNFSVFFFFFSHSNIFHCIQREGCFILVANTKNIITFINFFPPLITSYILYNYIYKVMIKIVGAKKNDKRAEENKSSSKDPKSNPGYIRLTKDLQSIDIPRNAEMTFPNKEDITKFDVKVKPEEGSYWFGAKYHFSVSVPTDYPHEPPKIECNTKVTIKSVLIKI